MTAPTPITVEVCSVCHLSWVKHLRTATSRAWSEYPFDEVPPLDSIDVTVTLHDCVTALLWEGSGPVGAAGATGATGPAGPRGKRGPAGRAAS